MKIGSLEIEIAANLARLRSDMDETKKVVSTAMKDVETYVGYAKTAFISLTGVAGVGAFVGMISGAIEGKARLYDLSLQTGISVEALSALGKVAKFSNTSLDEIAGASNKLSKALFTQNEDSKGAAQAIAALGLNFDRFKQMQPDQQLLAIAKAMSSFQDGTGKSAAAMLLFGKTGATLLPFLQELAEKNELVGRETAEGARRAKEYEDNLKRLKAAGDEWKRELVTGILPALQQVTSELVDGRKAYGGYLTAILDIGLNVDPFKGIAANIQSTHKQVDDLQAALAKNEERKSGGIFDKMFVLSPQAEADARQQLDLLEKREAYLKAQQQRQALALGAGVGDDPRLRRQVLALRPDPAKDATPVKDEYDSIIQKINEKISAQELELGSGQRLTAGQEEALRVMDRIRAGLSGTTREENALIAKMLERMLASEKLVTRQRDEAKAMEETLQARERLFDTEARRLQQLQEEADSMRHQVATYGMTAEELKALETARLRDAAAALEQKAALADDAYLPQIAQLYRDQAAALRETAKAREDLAGKEASERNDPASGANRAIKEYLDTVKRAGDSTYGAVRNAIGGLEDLGTDLVTKGHADVRSYIDAVIAEFVRLQIIRPMLAGIFGTGGAGGLVGQLFGRAAGASAGFGTGTGFGNLDIGGFLAGGGPAESGSLYRVNEKGPELLSVGGADYLMMGGQSGQVTPNDKLGGGKGVHITYAPVQNIQSGVSKAEVWQIAAEANAVGRRQMLEDLRTAGVVR